MIAVSLAALAMLAGFPSPAIDADSGQGRPTRSLFKDYFPKPSGTNGYEEYLNAADLIDTDEFRAFSRYEEEAKSAPWVDEDGKPMPKPPLPPGVRENSTLLEIRRAWVQRFGRVLDLVAAGNLKPAFDPRTDFDFETTFPELAKFKNIAKFMAMAAEVRFADGSPKAGTDLLLDALKFGDSLAGRSMIHTLVSTAIASIVFAGFERNLPRLSEKDCLRVRAEVDALLSRPSAAARTYQSEGAMLQRSLGRMKLEDFRDSLDVYTDDEDVASRLKNITPAQWDRIRQDVSARVGAHYQELARRLSSGETHWRAARDFAEEEEEASSGRAVGPDSRPEDLLADTIQLISTGFIDVSARSRTQMRLLRLHALVLGFQWHHGRLPSSLAEAVPESEQVDPIIDKPFQYELIPGGYRLFSRGLGNVGIVELKYSRPQVGEGRLNDPPIHLVLR